MTNDSCDALRRWYKVARDESMGIYLVPWIGFVSASCFGIFAENGSRGHSH